MADYSIQSIYTDFSRVLELQLEELRKKEQVLSNYVGYNMKENIDPSLDSDEEEEYEFRGHQNWLHPLEQLFPRLHI